MVEREITDAEGWRLRDHAWQDCRGIAQKRAQKADSAELEGKALMDMVLAASQDERRIDIIEIKEPS